MLLVLVSVPLWGQDTSGQSGATPDQTQPPVPAYGQDNSTPPPTSENPPISGIDQPGLEPHAAPLSYLQPGVSVSESLDSNIADQFGGSATHSLTTALGRLQLERLWNNFDLGIDYAGGVSYYNINAIGFRQVQQLNIGQRLTWKRGQLELRDCFSYLPEGNMGLGYGMANSPGEVPAVNCGGQGAFFGGAISATLGQVSRMTNLTMLNITQNLSPKSSITLTGGYGFLHYRGGPEQLSDLSFLNNSQVSAQVAYDRILGPRDQAAIMYGYQGFSFSTTGFFAGNQAQGTQPQLQPGSSFHTHVVQAMWGHRISGRMNLLLAAGPQITHIAAYQLWDGNLADLTSQCQFLAAFGGNLACPARNTSIGASGRFSLQYQLRRTNLELGYDRFTSAGGGIFAGAKTDSVHFSASRPLNRIWTGILDVGYAKNVREFQTTTVNATTFKYFFAGAAVHRRIGHELRFFTSYQFDEITLQGGYCGAATSCTSQRNVGSIGIDWSPRPMRLE